MHMRTDADVDQRKHTITSLLCARQTGHMLLATHFIHLVPLMNADETGFIHLCVTVKFAKHAGYGAIWHFRITASECCSLGNDQCLCVDALALCANEGDY